MKREVPITRVRLERSELRAVQRVLKSGQLRAGRVVEKFEMAFADTVGARFAVAVNSGTTALYMACRLLLKPGEEVIVPDFTFVATASMVLAAGLKPVLADVDPLTFNLDPEQTARRITRRTGAIIPVHLFGQPANIGSLAVLARGHGLRVIWDAAQAHGARYQGRDVGAFPDVVCYSFYPSKNMTTGEGGMLTTSNESLAQKLRLLRSHGEASRYYHTGIGFNFRMTDIAAALGCEQLKKLRTAVSRRRRNAAILTRGLSKIPGVETPRELPDTFHAYNCYTIRIDPGVLGTTRDALQSQLARRGIQTAVHYPLPLHQQPIFQGYGTDRDFPASSSLAKTVLSLPVYHGLSRKELAYVVKSVRDYLTD